MNRFALLFFCTLTLFFISLQSQFVFGGDSAEYSTSLATWSIPHPPGYPLYTFLGNVLTHGVPIGSVPWRVALLSSIPAGASLYFLYEILKRLTKHKIISCIATAFYAFLFPVWLYSIVPEVFALNNLLILLITFCIIRYNETKRPLFHTVTFFLLGLSVAHHHTFVLFIPGWYLLLDEKIRKKFLCKTWWKNILYAVLGMSVYVYAPLASMYHPPYDWENASSLTGFIRLITRASYGTFRAYTASTPNLPSQSISFFSFFILMLQDLKPLGAMLTVFGLLSLRSISPKMRSFILTSLGVTLFFLFYTNFTINSAFAAATVERYLIFVYLVLIMLFAAGCTMLLKLIENHIVKRIKTPVLKKFARGGVMLFFILFISISFWKNYQVMQEVKNLRVFEDYAENIINTAPKNSIVSVAGDLADFLTSYAYFVEHKRSDIKLLKLSFLADPHYAETIRKRYPDIFIPQYHNDYKIFMEEFLKRNAQNHQIFVEGPVGVGSWAPYGLLWKYYKNTEDLQKDIENVVIDNQRVWTSYHLTVPTQRTRNLLFATSVTEIYKKTVENYIAFLSKQKQFNQALLVISQFKPLIPADVERALMSTIFIEQGDCEHLKFYADFYLAEKTDMLSFDEVRTILKYFGLCDKKNPKIYDYLPIYRDFVNRPL